MGKEKHWIEKQREDVGKIFAPKLDYDKEHDILYITWLPHLNCDYSLPSNNGFVFDISKKPEQDVKGVEIFDFMKKLKESKEPKERREWIEKKVFRDKILAWANKYGYKGISKECEDDLEKLFESSETKSKTNGAGGKA